MKGIKSACRSNLMQHGIENVHGWIYRGVEGRGWGLTDPAEWRLARRQVKIAAGGSVFYHCKSFYVYNLFPHNWTHLVDKILL